MRAGGVVQGRLVSHRLHARLYLVVHQWIGSAHSYERKHRYDLLVKCAGPIALGAGRKLEALWPLAILEEHTRRDVVDFLRRSRSAAKTTEWVLKDELMTTIRLCAHG